MSLVVCSSTLRVAACQDACMQAEDAVVRWVSGVRMSNGMAVAHECLPHGSLHSCAVTYCLAAVLCLTLLRTAILHF